MQVFTVPKGLLNIKKGMSVLLCIQGESVTKRSTKLNQQNESFCVSREKLLITVDIREFKIYDETVAKTSLKIASSSFSIYFAIMSVCLTFES